MLVVDLLGDLYATTWWVPMADAGLQQWPGGWAVESRADAYGPGPPLGTYRLRVPASRVGYVPEAQGGLPRAPRVLYVLGTRTRLGRTVRTVYRGNAGDALVSWGLVPREGEGEASPTPTPPGAELGVELGAEGQLVMPAMPGTPLHCHQGGSVPPGS